MSRIASTPAARSYAIIVSCGPDASGSATALAFCRALLRRGHTLRRVFFQELGVEHFHRLRRVPQGMTDLANTWQQFLTDQAVETVVCVSSANRQGILDETTANSLKASATLLPPAVLGGLGSFAESILDCDHVLHFGKPDYPT